MTRRTVLSATAYASAAVGLGVPAFSGTALGFGCPLSPTEWQEADWPETWEKVNNLQGIAFESPADGRAFLGESPGDDVGRRMARQLVATVLNFQHRGPEDPDCVDAAAADVDGDGEAETVREIKQAAVYWLKDSGWTTGDPRTSWTVDGTDGAALADALAAFNTNRLDIDCGCPDENREEDEEQNDQEPEEHTPSPSFRIVERSVDRTSVHTDEPVTVTVVVENRGAAGSFKALLTDDTGARFKKREKIGADGSRTYEIPVSFDAPGSYTLRFNYRIVEEITVEEQPPAPLDPEDVAVTSASIVRSTVWADESYEISAVVENQTGEAGVAAIPFEVADGSVDPADASVETTTEITLDPGASAELRHGVTVETSPEAPVDRTWFVDGTHAGSVRVLPADEVDTGVVDAYLTPQTVPVGEPYEVVAVVHNAEEVRRLVAVNFAKQEGELGALRIVTLGPGETREISRTAEAPADAGAGDVAWMVNGHGRVSGSVVEQ